MMFRYVGTKERLVDKVVNEIQQQITEGGLAPGMMLPPERELCEQLGVSRTVLREAVRMLVTKGLAGDPPGSGYNRPPGDQRADQRAAGHHDGADREYHPGPPGRCTEHPGGRDRPESCSLCNRRRDPFVARNDRLGWGQPGTCAKNSPTWIRCSTAAWQR